MAKLRKLDEVKVKQQSSCPNPYSSDTSSPEIVSHPCMGWSGYRKRNWSQSRLRIPLQLKISRRLTHACYPQLILVLNAFDGQYYLINIWYSHFTPAVGPFGSQCQEEDPEGTTHSLLWPWARAQNWVYLWWGWWGLFLYCPSYFSHIFILIYIYNNNIIIIYIYNKYIYI